MIQQLCLDSPIGKVFIQGSEFGVTYVGFYPKQALNSIAIDSAYQTLIVCHQQLTEYFLGQRKHFVVKLDLSSGTSFQQSVWEALKSIPYGEVRSYRDIAQIIHNPKAVRAVGSANSKNPISFIIPCHRVIGVNNKLIGYAGGVERKRWLLVHEKGFK